MWMKTTVEECVPWRYEERDEAEEVVPCRKGRQPDRDS